MSKKHKIITNFLISIIIPVYRRFDLLQKCLDAIPDAFGDLAYEVVIVDNGSPLEEKSNFYPKATLPPNTRVIYVLENVGFPKACNRGAKAATGVLFFFLNSDVILDAGAGERLVMTMDDPLVGVAGMKLIFPSEEELVEANLRHSNVQRSPGTVQHVGLFTNIRGEIIHMYLGWNRDNPRVNQVKEAYAVTGAAFMTKKFLFRELRGFDEAYGSGTFEDVDFCMKVHEKNLRIVVDVNAVGKHYTGATAEQFQMAFPLHQNRMLFEQRWYNKLKWTEYLYW